MIEECLVKARTVCFLHSLGSFKLTRTESSSINMHSLVWPLPKYAAEVRKANKMLNSVRVEGRIMWKMLSGHYMKKAFTLRWNIACSCTFLFQKESCST